MKKEGYSASIINDLVFQKTRKVLQSKQKQLKKQGKGNKPNASVAILYCAICLPNSTGKNLSTYEINKLQHGKCIYDFYSLVDTYQKTHLFAALTCSFSNTTQLVNKNRTRECSISISSLVKISITSLISCLTLKLYLNLLV